jgi:uncharacterized protein YlxP (DUF503 family)
MHVLAVEIELHIPEAHSLKDKRQVVKSIVEGARRRLGVAAAETGRQDSWQRSTLGFAVVSSSVKQAELLIDDVERFVWSRGNVEVLSAERTWLE